VPWPVILEGAGVGVGFFHRQLKLDADLADPLFLSALTLAGARLTRNALSGKLLQGPRAWGGAEGGVPAFGGVAGGGALPARPAIRALPSRVAVGGGFNLYPATQETAGVAG